jgi:hypothetical protein
VASGGVGFVNERQPGACSDAWLYSDARLSGSRSSKDSSSSTRERAAGRHQAWRSTEPLHPKLEASADGRAAAGAWRHTGRIPLATREP